MSIARPYRPRAGQLRGDGRPSYGRNSYMGMKVTAAANYTWNNDSWPYDSNFFINNHGSSSGVSQNLVLDGPSYDHVWPDVIRSSKRRKVSDLSYESNDRPCQQPFTYRNGLKNHADMWQHVPPQFFNDYYSAPLVCDKNSTIPAATRSDGAAYSTTSKRSRSTFEDDEEVFFMSRDEIERSSPSRKDGIDVLHETHLRYSYCAFLQNLGLRLDL